tara:strand:- start:198 stop:515 length:318 start_codon:yes stop_codon:yes gene_type:complete
MAKYISIDNNVTAVHVLVSKATNTNSNLKSIAFSNTSASQSLGIRLFLDNELSPGLEYIIAYIDVPPTTTYVYDGVHINFDSTKYALKVNLTPASGNRFLDIIIN